MFSTKKILPLFLLIIGFGSLSAQQEPSYEVGDEIAPFSLPNAYGQIISPLEQAEKGAILVFTNQQCEYVNFYTERISHLHETYRALGYPVIAIEVAIESFENSTSALPSYLAQNKFKFEYLVDINNEVTKKFGVQSSPQVILLEKVDNSFLIRYAGSIDNNSRRPQSVTKKYVEEAMKQILADEDVKLPETKSIGCHVTG